MKDQTETGDLNAGHKRVLAYGGIIFVVLIWGLYPVFAAGLLSFYSGGAFTFVSSLISAVVLLPECFPKRKLLNATYFKIAVPTGLFVGAANLTQKIGLQYTTPTQFAFLENLSCVVVPLLLFLYVKKKPHPLTIGASLLCLFGCFVLSGLISSGGGTFGIGEILCALAGIFYGVNIATTGVFAIRLNAVLYLTIQMWVNVVVSGVAMVVLNAIQVNGAPLEAISFSWEPKHLLLLAVLVLSTSTFAWLIRTAVLKYISATAVAVILPFSSVVTGIVAVFVGQDAFSFHLLFGGLLILLSSFLSTLADIRAARTAKKQLKEQLDDD